jgi:hypothetical protein
MDEVLRTICSLISPDLLFHISSCKIPNEAWTTLEGIFGKQDDMRGHILEVELLTLDPKIFDNIKYKIGPQLNSFTILSNIVPFVSTFHSFIFTSRDT